MRPKGSAKVLEARRRRALTLLDQGLSLNEVGRKLGCAPSSVMRWQNRVRRHGAAGVTVRSSPGRPPKLRAGERRHLVRLLLKGALAHGYRTDLWTTTRIARVIKRGFRIQYHPDHVGRLMHSLGWSHQKPESRAVERNDAEIARWKREDWPRVKKTPRGWEPTSSSSTNPASC
jgi:transposase